MRKQLLILVTLLLCSVQVSLAQTRVITGVVRSASDNSVIPGASVVVTSTTVGTVTDFDGAFKLKIPEGAPSLTISFIGMKKIVLPLTDKIVYDVTLEEDHVAVGEVVVAALGISREKKSLGYSVQNVSGDELNQTKQSNVVSALSGKVSGVQVSGSSGSMGGSSRILIRGASSVTGNNQPLFVVDGVPIDNSNFNSSTAERGAGGYDYGNMAQDINPEDIATMSVLKGPSAAALYGSRAANGVIMITTKKGSKGNGIGISVSSGVAFERVNRLPQYQTSYGGGNGSFEQEEINGQKYNVAAYKVDESWGPKYDPTLQVLHWDAFLNGDKDLKTRPWVAPANDVEKFFDTGVTYNNSVSFAGGNEKSKFRMSISSVNTDGYIPNSNLDKYTISFNGSTALTDKLKVTAGVSYVNTAALGRPETGYGDNNIMVKFSQWGQRQVDMDRLKNYKNDDGTQNTWNRTSSSNSAPKYHDNPYWTRYQNYSEDERARYMGNVGLTYDFNKSLKASVKTYHDSYVFRSSERVAVGSQKTSSYAERVRQSNENNFEGMLNFNKNVTDDISVAAMVGGNIRKNAYHYNYVSTKGGLNLPNLYVVSNSKDPVETIDKYTSMRPIEKKLVYSAYGSLGLGFKNTYYLDATFRNDWSSTLPIENRSFFYPSFTGSVVISELSALKDLPWFTFGKVRAGWAMVGNDTSPYSLQETYTNYQPNFGGVARYSTPNTLPTATLKPEITKSWEIGAELKFFNNRIGIDATYYSNRTEDLITSVAVSPASGYLYNKMNAGVMTNKGFEIMFTATPIQTSDFSWDLSLNFAKNNNKLVELAEGIDNYKMANAPFEVTVNAFVGETYGAIMGTNFVFDNAGNKIVSTKGEYLKSETAEVLGTVLPDYNLGLNNSFRYKNLTVTALIDVQKGGSYFSTTNMWGMYTGMLEGSVHQNGVDIREKGIVIDGVYGKIGDDGNVVYTDKDGNTSASPIANTKNLKGEDYSRGYYTGPNAQNVFDASYIKLREVTVGYTIPGRYTGPIKNVNISLYGRNLAVWGLSNESFDPESAVTSSGNVQGIEGGALPSTATFGVNLKLKF
ncbi:SusC/RagA family TonB-linked outer membrane protein [Halosquirtibacter xylanolyticus]|uniref:SusC/RagA family TonB-linked outer membrane protein n=1 Tax=Halosquirtibacter xylanolyticus TaxID=3374599 RepID=UPI003748042F|nr:SusC/RagA family TonB-linked outer membrane protein [Prolixibacteraceae bacterium]